MEYSQVILEMLERIKTLEDRVNALEQRVGDERPAPAVNGKVSAKYRALAGRSRRRSTSITRS